MKKCVRCNLYKDEAEFYGTKDGHKDNLRSWCKKCCIREAGIRKAQTPEKSREATRLSRIKNIEKRLVSERRQNLKKYGVTPEFYDELLESQNGKCAICESSDPSGRGTRFHLDHNHETGKVRGLLCSKCNTGIGLLKDSKEIIRKALIYLEKDK